MAPVKEELGYKSGTVGFERCALFGESHEKIN
jgi:hypothetical protein